MKSISLFLVFGVIGVFCDETLPVDTVGQDVLEYPLSTSSPVLLSKSLTDLPRNKADSFQATLEVTESLLEDLTERSTLNEVDVKLNDDYKEETLTFAPLIANCSDNELYMQCGPRCYQTCAFQPRNGGGRRTRAVCEGNISCQPGCFCKSGYVRFNGMCIQTADCPTRPCSLSNEEYKTCGTPCTLSCDNFKLADEIELNCPNICVKGCFCKSGYVRGIAGLCVLPTTCPRPLII
ncbi:unnamed protein product [Diamesa tonsa]